MKRLLSIFLLVFTVVILLLSAPRKSQDVSDHIASAAGEYEIYIPVALNRFDPQFPSQMFGMQVYGSTAEGSTYYQHLINSQTSWVRNNISWQSVEPANVAPSEYDWATVDSQLSVAADNMNLIVVVDVVPTWARLPENSHPNGPIAADSLDDFSEFVQALVERYDGDGYQDAPGSPIVRHWEFFNEPDLDSRWGYYPEAYAAMLKVAYPAAKKASVSAQVLFAGIAFDWFEDQGGRFIRSFLNDVLAAGAGDYFDVMNFHVYPLFEPNWGGGSTGLIGKTTVIRETLAQYGLEKPMVITEAGWYNNGDAEPGSSDDEQVTRLVQLMTQGLTADIKVLIWWMLWDPGDGISDYGLVTSASPPGLKPSYTAYQTAVYLLNNTISATQLTSAETGTSNLEAYRMVKANNVTIYTAWMNPYGTTETRTLRVPANSVTVLDGLGNVVGTAVDSNNDGYVNVTIGSQPVYIQVVN